MTTRQNTTSTQPAAFARWWRAGVVGLLACVVGVANAQILLDETPKELEGVGVVEKLGERVPGDIPLFTADGESVLFERYLAQDEDDRRPIVLMMVYYDCPLLCGLVMERAHEAFNQLSYQIGDGYKVVVVSFDHTNTPAMAKGKQTGYRARYVHASEINADPELKAQYENSYVFHTAAAGDARALADSIGFNYNFVPGRNSGEGEYSHPAVLTVLTPDGTISRYIDALEVHNEPKQLRVALLEASDGAIGDSLGDIFLHSCFVWDPDAGVYSLEAMRAMQIASVTTVVGLGGFVGVLFVTDRLRKNAKNKRTQSQTQTDPTGGARPASPAHA